MPITPPSSGRHSLPLSVRRPPSPRRRRWLRFAVSAAVGAVIAGVVTIPLTITANSVPSAAPTASVTAVPPKPARLPATQADKLTCSAYGTVDFPMTAAAKALSVIPPEVAFTDPAIQTNPRWRAAVVRASQLYGQAADGFEHQIAVGTTPLLAQIADITVSQLRTLSEAYKTFDPASDEIVTAWAAHQKAFDSMCRK
jgi:hypothetical protein